MRCNYFVSGIIGNHSEFGVITAAVFLIPINILTKTRCVLSAFWSIVTLYDATDRKSPALTVCVPLLHTKLFTLDK